MVVLPVTSVFAVNSFANTPQSLMVLVGTWFVFWAVGVRLVIAGLAQILRPKFAAEQIFDVRSDDALPIVQELGIANLATGVVGVISMAVSQFTLPAAIAGSILYGVTGWGHAMESTRTTNESAVMVSNLFVSAVLALYVAWVGLRMLIGRV